MDTARHRYKPTPADPARVERVHRLITENAEQFRTAASRLDEVYTIKACLDRALNRLPFTEETGTAARKLWTDRADAALRRCEELKGTAEFAAAAHAETELRATAQAYRIPTLTDWDRRAARFREAVRDLLVSEIDVSVPNPSWDWSANVLLLFWLVCDSRAEKAVHLTDFQRWLWNPTDDELVGREIAQWFVPEAEWPEVIRAVDLALAVSRHHVPNPGPEPERIVPVQQSAEVEESPEMPQLNDKELAAHLLLLRRNPLAPLSSGKLSEQLARQGVALADDVFRKQTAPKLRGIGLEAGSTGYFYPSGCLARRLGADGGTENPQVSH